MRFVLIIFIVIVVKQVLAHGKCPNLKLKNGTATFLNLPTRKLSKFKCDTNYTLIGDTMSVCYHESQVWDKPVPVCIKSGCGNLTRLNGKVSPIDKTQSALSLTCEQDFELAGSKTTYCDGHNWDRPLGECRRRRKADHQTMSCDFENENNCEWTWKHTPHFVWSRSTGADIVRGMEMVNGSYDTRSGPVDDRTKSKNGFFLVAKSTGFNNMDSTELVSPMYSPFERNLCFKFYMFRFGQYRDWMGTLSVLLKPKTRHGTGIWTSMEPQENAWRQVVIPLGYQSEQFQIIIKAETKNYAAYSDIAIDDVELDVCPSVTTTDKPTDIRTTSISTVPLDESVETTTKSDVAVTENMKSQTTTSGPMTTGAPKDIHTSTPTTPSNPEDSIKSASMTNAAPIKDIRTTSTPTTRTYRIDESVVIANGTLLSSGHPLPTGNQCVCVCQAHP